MKKKQDEPPEGRYAGPVSFSAVIADDEGLDQGARGNDLATLLKKLVLVLLLVGGLVSIGYPFVLQGVNAFRQASESQDLEWRLDHETSAEELQDLAAADQYNQELAKSGQSVMGDVADPFSNDADGSNADGSGGDDDNADDNTVEAKDKRYQSLLNEGGGVMGMVVVPKIAVDLSIYHGTSSGTMDIGAGHMYGTSLPVGGPSTHTVLVSHNGLTNALMFTRLDEMRKGDAFFIHVPGRRMGYRIDRIVVIKPTDTSKLRVEPGADRATLMTCYPYGVNDHRLLIQGHRDPSLDKQYPSDFGRQVMAAIMAAVTALSVLVIGVSLLIILKYRHPNEPPAGHAQTQDK
ncbi:class C sortase [Bifidobacterium sp. ESL0764]|uniref:class C sortase n=1 Tax=Bifidobacterium sp. ESL0764 TaxID=2983228 RepID=UPI0023F6F2B1|nr:class C sortase [Bifidobacterium sp. ESL0764]WEV65417.1 class C sortase [Bifidobacterium sp. ESL0764]